MKIGFFSKRDSRFVDLGSGIGKAAVVAALCFNFREVCAIEIVPKLHELAIEIIEKEKDHEELLKKVQLMNGDMFDESMIEIWKKHTILFVSTTCFTNEMLNQ